MSEGWWCLSLTTHCPLLKPAPEPTSMSWFASLKQPARLFVPSTAQGETPLAYLTHKVRMGNKLILSFLSPIKGWLRDMTTGTHN